MTDQLTVRAAAELGQPPREYLSLMASDGSTVPDVESLIRDSSRARDATYTAVSRRRAKWRPANAVLSDIATGRASILEPGTVDAMRPFREQADAALATLLVNGALQGQRHMPRAPRTTGNTAELLVRNEQFVPRVLEDIANAKHSISITQFNWEPNGSGRQVLEALRARKAQVPDLDIRVILDNMGFNEPGKDLAADFQRELEDAGAKVERTFNFRGKGGPDHRKVWVFDDKIAYSGGIGLGEKYGTWTDHYARVEGPAGAVVGAHQLGAWRDVTDTPLDDAATTRLARIRDTLRDNVQEVGATGAVTPIENRPGTDLQITEGFLDDSAHATQRFWTSSTYATNPDALEALKAAARRGVDVRVMVSAPGTGFDDDFLKLGRTRFEELLDAGVKVFERSQGAGEAAPDAISHMHAKGWLADGSATVGSMNLSMTCMRMSREAAMRIEDPAFVDDYARFFEDATAGAKQVGTDDLVTGATRLLGTAARRVGLHF